MNPLLSVLNIQWCDLLILPLLPYKAVRALKYPALQPAMWVPENTPLGKPPHLIEIVSSLALTGFLGAGFLSGSAGHTFPKETH